MPHPALIPVYRFVFRALDALRHDLDDARFSAALCLGFALGMTPIFTLHELCFVCLALVLRINPLVTAGTFLFFAALSAPFDPFFHELGLRVLTPPELHRLWAGLYHWPVLPHMRFYNTVVMGRALVTALGLPVLGLGCRMVLRDHRPALVRAILGSPLWQTVATSRLYRIYARYHRI